MRTCRYCEERFDPEDSPYCRNPENRDQICKGKPRGFAAMSPERVREIAASGGRMAHETGQAHVFTSEEAKAAGVKGGAAPHKRRGRIPRAKAEAP